MSNKIQFKLKGVTQSVSGAYVRVTDKDRNELYTSQDLTWDNAGNVDLVIGEVGFDAQPVLVYGDDYDGTNLETFKSFSGTSAVLVPEVVVPPVMSPQAGATAHWSFLEPDTSSTDVIGQRSLTYLGTPTYGANYVTLEPIAGAKGATTDIIEAALPSETITIVFRHENIDAGAEALFGTLHVSADKKGFAPHFGSQREADATRMRRYTYFRSTGTHDMKSDDENHWRIGKAYTGEWNVMTVARNLTEGNTLTTIKLNGNDAVTITNVDPIGPYVSSLVAYGMGNCYGDSDSVTTDVAEFIFFDKYLTEEEVNQVHTDVVARCAEFGITTVTD